MTQIVDERTEVTEMPPEIGGLEVPAAPVNTTAVESILEDELVEDVSIDGMCGVY